jgi:hypothetical protein
MIEEDEGWVLGLDLSTATIYLCHRINGIET